MRIVVDVVGAPAESGGMRLYAEELIRSWAELDDEDTLIVVGGPWITEAFRDLDRVVTREVRATSALGRAVAQMFSVALIFWTRRADAVLSVSPIVTRLVPRVARHCVVHDWRHLRQPTEFSISRRLYRDLWRRSVRWAGHVSVISTKTLLETVAQVPQANISLIENGRDHPRRWAGGDSHCGAAASGISALAETATRTILTFGHHRNKRPELVIEAAALLPSTTRDGLRIVVLGARGAHADRLRILAEKSGVSRSVEFPGFVTPAAYSELLRTSCLIVMASTDEGFGLPIVEAQYFGIPAVATRDSGLGEIHGGDLTLVDATPGGLAAGMLSALRHYDGMPTGADRSGIRTWREVSRETRAALTRVLAGQEGAGKMNGSSGVDGGVDGVDRIDRVGGIAEPRVLPRRPRARVSTVLGLLPAGRIKNRLLGFAGHSIHPSASIAPNLILGSTRLSIARGARVGPLNCFRNVHQVRLGENAEIGQLNWFSAAEFLIRESASGAAGTLRMGPNSSVTNRHYFDVSGGVSIGEFALVAGVRSVLMTHGIDVADNVLDTASITVGAYCMVGGGCQLVLGAVVPARSVVAMGSVVVRGLTEPDMLYAGVPARAIRPNDAGEFGMRTQGPVRPRLRDPFVAPATPVGVPTGTARAPGPR